MIASKTQILTFSTHDEACMKACTTYLQHELTRGGLRFQWESFKARPVSYHLTIWTKDVPGPLDVEPHWLTMVKTIMEEEQ